MTDRTVQQGWFSADKEGLRQILEALPDPTWPVRELVQNAFDEPGVTVCDVGLEETDRYGSDLARITVEDDAPEGFVDIAHAYTFFAPTRKRPDPNSRGWFNSGEKHVLAMCREASVRTTKGSVLFSPDGKRIESESLPTERGSVFYGIIYMKRETVKACECIVRTYLPPKGIRLVFNGEQIPYREPKARISVTLPTRVQREDGKCSETRRKTEVWVYEPRDDEEPMLYELGLPVQPTGDRWHYSVQQRIPLSSDRAHIRPSYLRAVRVAVLNELHDDLAEEDASAKWVRDAASDKKVEVEAVRKVADLRWGEKRTVSGPGTPEPSRERAVAGGYHMVSPREMSAAEWEQMRKAEAVPSCSKLFPVVAGPADVVPDSELKDAHRMLAELAKRVAKLTQSNDITVEFIKMKNGPQASYDRRSKTLTFNLSRLRGGFWRVGPRPWLRLIIHELGHQAGGHLDEAYYEELGGIGATLALLDPGVVLGMELIGW